MEQFEERRRYSRKPVIMGLEYRRIVNGEPTEKFFTLGRVVELSLGGMKIEIPDRFYTNAQLEVLIYDSVADNVFHGLVEVVRFAGGVGPTFFYGARTRMLKRL